MGYSIRDLQARLNALGYHAGTVDGINGPRTKAAFRKAERDRNGRIFGRAGLHRVHLHWTAGAYGAIAVEKKAYNVLILHDGHAIMGDHAPEANVSTRDGAYAAHTRAANSGAIGVGLDAMGGAKERPFDPGKWPLTWPQIERAALEVANICKTYDIPVSKWSTLTHAEVEPTLGIKQRWKWDITWLPDMDAPGDPIEVGDRIRKMIEREM